MHIHISLEPIRISANLLYMDFPCRYWHMTVSTSSCRCLSAHATERRFRAVSCHFSRKRHFIAFQPSYKSTVIRIFLVLSCSVLECLCYARAWQLSWTPDRLVTNTYTYMRVYVCELVSLYTHIANSFPLLWHLGMTFALCTWQHFGKSHKLPQKSEYVCCWV